MVLREQKAPPGLPLPSLVALCCVEQTSTADSFSGRIFLRSHSGLCPEHALLR